MRGQDSSEPFSPCHLFYGTKSLEQLWLAFISPVAVVHYGCEANLSDQK